VRQESAHELPGHRYEGRNCGDRRRDPDDPAAGLMPAIFYLSLPVAGEPASTVNRLSQIESSHAVEPHPFDAIIDRVTSAAGVQPAGGAGTERRNG
jgi:hypothetical protein